MPYCAPQPKCAGLPRFRPSRAFGTGSSRLPSPNLSPRQRPRRLRQTAETHNPCRPPGFGSPGECENSPTETVRPVLCFPAHRVRPEMPPNQTSHRADAFIRLIPPTPGFYGYSMKTTLELSDALVERAKAVALKRRTTLRDRVTLGTRAPRTGPPGSLPATVIIAALTVPNGKTNS